jgi:predicted permease
MGLRQDVVVSLRALRASPGYALIVVATLALGIAANTLTLSLLTPYLIRELPFAEPESLVQIGQVDPVNGWDGGRFSQPMFRDWRERSRSFEDLLTYYYSTKNVTGVEGPERTTAGVLSKNAFDVLGVQAALGRTFLPDDHDTVVLSHGLWRRRYGADPAIVGRSIVLDGAPFTVVGVMPAEFNFPFGGVKMWIPLPPDAADEPRDRERHIPIGRLKDGVTREEVRGELEAIQRELGSVHPEVDGRFSGVSVKPLREALNFAYDVMEASFLVLLAAVAFVLLIACANVASLTLARTGARSREIAVRAALGARSARLVRELLTEGLLLAVAGGVLGVLLADWGARAIGPLIPEDLFRVGEVRVDGVVLLASSILTLATPLVFGLGPAIGASRSSLISALKEGGRTGTASIRWRRALVVAEIALSIVLAGGTGLMLRSFLELQDVDMGFVPENVLTVEVTLPESAYPDHVRQESYFERGRAELASLGPVRSVGVTEPLPMNHELWSTQFALPGKAPARSEDWPAAREFRVSPGYFDAMGIPLRAGRAVEAMDGAEAPKVLLVSESLARLHFPGRDAIGEMLLLGDALKSEPWTIVGVAADVKHDGFQDASPLQVYRPLAQTGSRGRFFVIETETSPESLAAAAREVLARIDPNLPVTLRPMREIVQESALQWSLSSWLLGVFAGVALALASLGIYGIIAYSVSARRREIGLRMALGATRSQIRGLVVREGLMLGGLGLAIGLALAGVAAKLIASLLYGVGPFDPPTFAAVIALFLATAIAASFLPADRAARTDPVGVLRHD